MADNFDMKKFLVENKLGSYARARVNEVDEAKSSVTKEHIQRMNGLRAMALMDVPPKNFQSPQMLPMMQKLLNVPASFIRLENFRMQDKTGAFYNPAAGEYPAI